MQVTTDKSLGLERVRGGLKPKREKVFFWLDPLSKLILTEFCKAEGLKVCETLEEFIALGIQNYKTKRTNLSLQLTLNRSISREDKTDLKQSILQEIKTSNPSKRPPLRLKTKDIVLVQCKCSPPLRKSFYKEYVDERGETTSFCSKCKSIFKLVPPTILANTPHFYCQTHPGTLQIAPVDNPPDCPKCGTTMTLIFQETSLEAMKYPKKPKHPLPAFDQKQQTLEASK